MYIQVECDIALEFYAPTPVNFTLALHPSSVPAVRGVERLEVDPPAPVQLYNDAFGNRCGRTFVMPGRTAFRHFAVVENSGQTDPQPWDVYQHAVEELPPDTLQFLLPSRYCEVDSELNEFAWSMFGHLKGWPLVRAVVDWTHDHLRFDYLQARNSRTALEGYRERVGVCRDFNHLALTLCRCLNVPARYCTGYLGDIGVPADPNPMDVSAWFQVYLGGQWWTTDARHNKPRIGRILIAHGRDAADVAMTTAFGKNRLDSFRVGTFEVPGPGC